MQAIWAVLLAHVAFSAELPTIIPSYKYQQTLVASSDLDDKTYLAFPILLRVAPSDLLIAFKRGYSHARDREAGFEVLHLDPISQRKTGTPLELGQPNLDFQDGEFARFPNGDIVCYLDVQASGQVVRVGLAQYRSTDGGHTFHYEGKLGAVDGVEYGYAFEALTSGQTTWMLVMTFSNLPGGKNGSASIPNLPEHAGSVDVIRSDDNGKSWRREKNLSREFGNIAINESSFARCGNGFVVATRGYNNRQWLNLTDEKFNLKKQIELGAVYPSIRSYIGRPRVFERDGRYYLLGRNWTEPGGTNHEAHKEMKLSLFRFDPSSLEITRQVILDNAGNERLADGYYAVPYWQERSQRQYLNIVTYKASLNRFPDIVRFEFDWDEVR